LPITHCAFSVVHFPLHIPYYHSAPCSFPHVPCRMSDALCPLYYVARPLFHAPCASPLVPMLPCPIRLLLPCSLCLLLLQCSTEDYPRDVQPNRIMSIWIRRHSSCRSTAARSLPHIDHQEHHEARGGTENKAIDRRSVCFCLLAYWIVFLVLCEVVVMKEFISFPSCRFDSLISVCAHAG